MTISMTSVPSKPGPVFDEEVLLAASLNGDLEAQRTLVHWLNPVIHAQAASHVTKQVACGRSATRADVDDLVQEVWSALLKNDQAALRRWRRDGGASLRSFVAICASRAIISHYRGGARAGNREYCAVEDDLPLRIVAADDVEGSVADKDLLRHLLRRLRERLSQKGWRALQLMFFEDLPMEEAQRRLGVTRSALYTWRREIRAEARAVLRELQHTYYPRSEQ